MRTGHARAGVLSAAWLGATMELPWKTMAALALSLCLASIEVCPAAASGGNGGASFLRFSPSPRGSGMGEAQVSAAQGPYSVYWNPAGLALLETPAMSAMHNSSFEDVSTQFIAGAYPLRYGSTLGFSISRLAVAPFQGYDSIGIKTSEVDASGIAVGAAYGRALLKDEISRPVLAAGAGLKYVGARLDDASANSAAMDLGAIYYQSAEKPYSEVFRADFEAEPQRREASILDERL